MGSTPPAGGTVLAISDTTVGFRRLGNLFDLNATRCRAILLTLLISIILISKFDRCDRSNIR
jgi:hypothetical protein